MSDCRFRRTNINTQVSIVNDRACVATYTSPGGAEAFREDEETDTTDFDCERVFLTFD